MERLSPTDYAGHVAVKLGPITAAFDGRITLSELDPPTSYRITVEAHGAIAGSAAGTAKVRLVDQPGGALLHYEASTEIGGETGQAGGQADARHRHPLRRQVLRTLRSSDGGAGSHHLDAADALIRSAVNRAARRALSDTSPGPYVRSQTIQPS